CPGNGSGCTTWTVCTIWGGSGTAAACCRGGSFCRNDGSQVALAQPESAMAHTGMRTATRIRCFMECSFSVVEFARPVQPIDVETERILCESFSRRRLFGHDGEDRGPAFRLGERVVLEDLFRPFDLERGVGNPHHARHLHRH